MMQAPLFGDNTMPMKHNTKDTTPIQPIPSSPVNAAYAFLYCHLLTIASELLCISYAKA